MKFRIFSPEYYCWISGPESVCYHRIFAKHFDKCEADEEITKRPQWKLIPQKIKDSE